MAFESVVLMTFAWIAIIYLIFHFRRLVFVKMVKNIPGPKALPLVGSVFHLLNRNADEIFGFLLSFARDYSSPFQVWMGNKLFIGIYEPDQIKIILQSGNCLNKGKLYKFIEPALGKASLLTCPASVWIKNRKILVSGFNSNMLQSFFDIFVEQSVIFTDQLEKIELNGNEIVLAEPILQCTATIACDTVLGVKWDLRADIISQVCKEIIRCRKGIRHRLQNIFLHPNIIYNLSASGRKQQKGLNFIRSFVDEMIQQRQCALNKSKTDVKEIIHRAICDMLLKKSNKESFTHDDIHDNVLTMLVAASDTIAITINFATFMLANFPEIQEKAYQELLGIYGLESPKFASIKYEDLQYMDYLDRVIKETMRLFPAVPLIARQLTEDLRLGEFILPKDADIIIALGKVLRNKKYWPNPLMFDPDRFLPERLGNTYWDYYIAFSNGPRSCIGMKYTMISTKVILATLIRTFVFKVDKSIAIDKIKLNFDILLSPTEPLKVKLERREFLSKGI
ncbi:cytochrome P450 4C1-like isoform X2 [Nylanderia fulva]|uniref:cytochrome P450 4C1-like isoform X2 n=1 Tax=Nylanderia fulva TaxID=613905 RepID=UPI0010FB4452|nr:cytochrome P450 4C1-like isoform X2 [Nylanderia fulva]